MDHFASILFAALATLGLGLVLGPEAPLIALGIALGAVAVHLTRVAATEAGLLVLAGAFAAIAALFGGPLVAAFLLLELVAESGMVSPHDRARTACRASSRRGRCARVDRRGRLAGAAPGSLVYPVLPYDTVRLDLLWCALISIAVAAVVVAARRSVRGRSAHARTARGLAGRRRSRGRGDRGRVPGRLPTGRSTSSSSRGGQHRSRRRDLGGGVAARRARRGVAYALSLGAGFRGGPVFPAIALGTALAVAAADILPGLDSDACRSGGIAAATAAALQAPFTGAVLGTLLVGSAAPDVRCGACRRGGRPGGDRPSSPARKPEPGDAGR